MTTHSLAPWHWTHRNRRRGLTPLHEMPRDFEQVFDEMLHGFGPMALPRDLETFEVFPDMDVSETDSDITVTVELPGLEEKDVEVTLTDNRLSIKGEKKIEREEKEKDYHLSERSYGSFHRMITLPAATDGQKTDATFSKGVLTVKIPKSQDEKSASRKIKIKSH